MRTTLTLDPDVHQLLEGEVRSSTSANINLFVSDSALRPGYGGQSFNGLADELEDEVSSARAVR